jgi:glucitol operon activator protein
MNPWFWLIAAVVAGWMVQMYVTYQQAASFSTHVRRLRSQGLVSVGGGGKRYRVGRAFVAIAFDPQTHDVVDAISLQGFTTFARAKAAPDLRGLPVAVLTGDEDIPGLTRQQREAARQAAHLMLEARHDGQAREEVRGVTEPGKE